MKNNYLRKSLLLFTTFVMLLSGVKLYAQNQNFLSFDGNDYVKYTDDATLGLLHGATSYTIEAWVYPKSGGVFRKTTEYYNKFFLLPLLCGMEIMMVKYKTGILDIIKIQHGIVLIQ